MKQKYYKQLSNPAPRSVVKSYRKLRKGEKLRETDMLWVPYARRLVSTVLAGERVCATNSTACHYYRRKSAKR